MLRWALTFFIVSIIAGLLGMYGVAGLTMDVAKILVGAFLILAIVMVVAGIAGGRKAKEISDRVV
jgi:uncharacterized membrane protein YtjA (UPF0391 family)